MPSAYDRGNALFQNSHRWSHVDKGDSETHSTHAPIHADTCISLSVQGAALLRALSAQPNTPPRSRRTLLLPNADIPNPTSSSLSPLPELHGICWLVELSTAHQPSTSRSALLRELHLCA